MNTAPIEIYTDGACKGNPGPGGWGAILRYRQHEKLLKGAEALTTNNRMELTAVIMALSSIKQPSKITIATDSQYVKQGITKWLSNWEKNGWRTSQKTAVKNIDLWQQLSKIAELHKIDWNWIKGHSNHPENDLADQLANEAVNELISSGI